MANHIQAIKRNRQHLKHEERNRARKSAMRTIVRSVHDALKAGNTEEATKKLAIAVKTINKTASAGVIHKNQASRRVSRLVKAFNKATAAVA